MVIEKAKKAIVEQHFEKDYNNNFQDFADYDIVPSNYKDYIFTVYRLLGIDGQLKIVFKDGNKRKTTRLNTIIKTEHKEKGIN